MLQGAMGLICVKVAVYTSSLRPIRFTIQGFVGVLVKVKMNI